MNNRTGHKGLLNTIMDIIFPIEKKELKKFSPLFLIYLFITFNYGIIRIIKDAFVMGRGGAEAIYYLKAYGVTPFVLLFTIVYGIFSKNLKRDGRFNFIILYLVSFFTIFYVFILPNLKFLQLESATNFLQINYPQMKGLWSILSNWHTSLFYIHAELWGSFAIVAFWTLANDITSFKQSSRFYSFIAMAANIGSLLAGTTATYICQGNPFAIISIFIVIGIITLFFYNYFALQMKKTPELYLVDVNKAKKPPKLKLNIFQSFLFIIRSKHLMLIAMLVISYNMSISLLESMVNSKWVEYANGNEELISKLGGLKIMFVGGLSIFFTLLASYLRRKNWSTIALFSPIAFLISFVIFYLFDFFSEYSIYIFAKNNIDMVAALVVLGTSNVIISRSSKYTFFDPSKESLYIPLDEESKIRGKAAVDGVGSRLGKGLGALLLTLVFFPLGGGQIQNCKNYISITILVMLIVWIFSVLSLSKMIKKLNKTSS